MINDRPVRSFSDEGKRRRVTMNIYVIHPKARPAATSNDAAEELVCGRTERSACSVRSL